MGQSLPSSFEDFSDPAYWQTTLPCKLNTTLDDSGMFDRDQPMGRRRYNEVLLYVWVSTYMHEGIHNTCMTAKQTTQCQAYTSEHVQATHTIDRL